MATNTTNMALPYPDPGDTLQTVDDAIKALALKLDGGAVVNATPSAGVTGTGTAAKRSGFITVKISLTLTAAKAGGAAIATIASVPHRPAVREDAVVVNFATGAPISAAVLPTGEVICAIAAAIGVSFVGRITYPSVL